MRGTSGEKPFARKAAHPWGTADLAKPRSTVEKRKGTRPTLYYKFIMPVLVLQHGTNADQYIRLIVEIHRRALHILPAVIRD